MSKTVWIAALFAMYPRLGDSLANPVLAEMNEAQHAGEDTAIRIANAKELVGKDYSARLPKTFMAPLNMAPAIHALTRRALKGKFRGQAHRIAETIVQESRRRRLDPVFLCAVIQHESRFVPTKKGQHGEIGLMQIRPGTGQWISGRYHLPWHGERTLWDPVLNIRYGAAYFDFLRTSFKARGQLYLSAYNLGPKKTREELAQKIRPKEYYHRVMHNFYRYQKQVSRFTTKYAELER